jgi:hypothetical protein
MKTQRSLMSLVAAGLVAAPMVAGCTALGETIANQFPATAPVFAPRPKSTPFALSKGHVRGRVFGATGKSQPIGLAFITTGSVSTFSANPREEDVVEEDDAVADKDNISVDHDFDGEDGPGDFELALRIIRKNPPSQDDEDRYVYLRPGEFFLEGVPEGNATLTASFGNVTSSPNPITVYKNTIVEDVSLNLFVPEPLVQTPDGTIPKIIEWAKLDPPNGVSVSVVNKRTTDNSGQVFVETTVTYKPDPPDCAVTLKAPPGSPGTVINAYEISYEYTTPNQQGAAKPPIVVGPILIPTPPLIVPPAQEIAFGPPIIVQIPIGSRTLNDVFSGEKNDQPGLVVAHIEFKDDGGVPVPGKDLNPLKVSVPLRAL